MLASRAALGVRVDAHSSWGFNSEDATEPSEEDKCQLGRTSKEMIERRLRTLEGKPLKSIGNANMTPVAKKWDVKEARKYNPDADGLTGEEPAAAAKKSGETPSKKKLVQEVESEDEDETMEDAGAGAEEDSESEDESAEKGEEKLSKAERKALKKARKAEREAKREAKAAKKAAKEAKKAAKEAKESTGKKRKHDEEGEKSEKKKKKKSKE